MKTKLLLFFLFIGFYQISGQNYYHIDFSGEPDSVLVENLTQESDVTVPGGDSLYLKLEGVSAKEIGISNRNLLIFPNPMDQSCRFGFENSSRGTVEILLINGQGKSVLQDVRKLRAGIHQYELSGVPGGIYFLFIKTGEQFFSGRFVSTYEGLPDTRITYARESTTKFTQEEERGKDDQAIVDFALDFRSIIEMDFEMGDELRFTGFKARSEDDIVFASPTGDQTIAFSFCVRPAQTSAISGKMDPCQGTTQSYSVTEVADVTYTWSVPADWMITAGQNTHSITVTSGALDGEVIVVPSNDCGNGVSQTTAVTTRTVPAQPSAISGMNDPCQGTSELVYSVNQVPGVSYSWTLPADWVITEGEDTNSITVSAGTGGGTISVTPSNECGDGAAQTLEVTAQSDPLQPSAISGKVDPCQNSAEIYEVENVQGMSYTWSVPADWTITDGQNTHSITVTVGAEFGTIGVEAYNNCGTGPSRTLAVTTQTGGAGQPSEITGDLNPCQGTTDLEYAVVNVQGLNYTWTVPSDWTITSGQGSHSITVTAGSVAGNISVTPSNDCGNGPARNLAVIVQTVPDQPAVISGDVNPCENETGLVYSVMNVADVTYNWTVPAGWTITSGQFSNSITVIASSTNGAISVVPSNDCGEGPVKTLAVTTQTVPDQPSAISGDDNPCENETGLNYSVADISGVTYIWTVPLDWTITSGQNSNNIVVDAGSASGEITVTPSNDCGNGIASSIDVTAQLIPDQPSVISGADDPCENEPGLVYTVTNVPDLTYNWTVPSGWMITAGQNSNSITVTAGTATGNIEVSPSNDCGIGPAQSLWVTTHTVPEQTSTINGNDDPCENEPGLVYSVTNVPDVTYNWIVPSGWAITSGQNSNSIVVTAGTNAGMISVTPSNDCGDGESRTMAVTLQTVPDQPSVISGDVTPCQDETGLNYSVTHVPGVTYFWTLPSGWTITSGQNSNNIVVTVGTASGAVTVTPSNACGDGVLQSLIVNTQLIPGQPSTIIGDDDPCEDETGLNYSVTNVPDVTYNWTLPSDWTITSGQNSNSITVTAGAMTGSIQVTPTNDCGTGPTQSLWVTTHSVPNQPSAITGDDHPCEDETGLNYSVINVPEVTYNWTVPSGWAIISGQNSNSIVVTAGTNAGMISVTPSNDCGDGEIRTMAVTTQAVPDQPSAISGDDNPCQDETGLVYSVNNVSGVTYTWTLPSGWTIISGQNSNSITVTAGTSAGTISVTPSNDCGDGPARSLAVSVQLVPDQPSVIMGDDNPCEDATGLNYTVNNVSGVTYTWTLPSGWTITSGQNTNSVTVTAGSSAGTISVTPSNDCGDGPARALAVSTHTIPDQPSVIMGDDNPCEDATGLNYTVNNVSGVTYTWTLPSGWTITSGQNTNSVTVTAGSSAGTISVTPSNDCGDGPARMLAVTAQVSPTEPSEGSHVPTQTQIEWNWNTVADATGYKYHTTDDYASATDNGTSTTHTQTGLTCNTAYTLYVWAYNDCGHSASVALNESTTACSSGCGGDVTFMYNGTMVTYGTVASADGRCWLDRNLGATQVATSSTDEDAYGDLFQWGRLDDGHQERTSTTTTTLSNSDVPGHDMFIRVTSGSPYDWRSPQNDNLWQGVSGTNNTCPTGYRLPTEEEWNTERLSWSSNNAAGAFDSPLKLPLAGYRNYSSGAVGSEGSYGSYWSSTVDGISARYLYFYSSNASEGSGSRAYGMSVRCIKD